MCLNTWSSGNRSDGSLHSSISNVKSWSNVANWSNCFYRRNFTKHWPGCSQSSKPRTRATLPLQQPSHQVHHQWRQARLSMGDGATMVQDFLKIEHSHMEYWYKFGISTIISPRERSFPKHPLQIWAFEIAEKPSHLDILYANDTISANNLQIFHRALRNYLSGLSDFGGKILSGRPFLYLCIYVKSIDIDILIYTDPHRSWINRLIDSYHIYICIYIYIDTYRDTEIHRFIDT